jgi:hypothetical protein
MMNVRTEPTFVQRPGGAPAGEAQELLNNLERQGFALAVRDGRLYVSPAGKLSPLVEGDIRRCQADLTRLVAVRDVLAALDDLDCFSQVLRQDVRRHAYPVRRLCRAARGVARLTGILCDVSDLLNNNMDAA